MLKDAHCHKKMGPHFDGLEKPSGKKYKPGG